MMDQVSLDLLIDRVESLERANRKWKRSSFIAVLVGVVTFVIVGARAPQSPKKEDVIAVPKVVEAEKLLVKDKQGKVRIELGSSGQNSAFLKFYSFEGNMTISLATMPDDDGSLCFWDRKQNLRLSLAHNTTNGFSAVNFHDQDGGLSVALGAKPAGGGGLQFFDREGKTNCELKFQPDGRPSFTFFDKDKNIRFTSYILRDGTPTFRFFDKDHKLLFEAPFPVEPLP